MKLTWGHEIVRALLLAMGTIEIITNTHHLLKKNGLQSARKQHGELPPNRSDKQIKTKVICMLSFGVIFFVISLLSYILHTYLQSVIFVSLILFAIYGITEALYYRFWKTFGFASVTIVLFFIQFIK